MAERSQLAQRVFDALEQPVSQMKLELVDVEFVKEGASRYLRIYIDKPGGVSIDNCTDVSRMADPIIDHDLKISAHDYLEVSSPGLERPLKSDRDFARYQGEWVEIKLYKSIEGRKTIAGRLAPCSSQEISLIDENENPVSFNRTDVARVKRIIHFE